MPGKLPAALLLALASLAAREASAGLGRPFRCVRTKTPITVDGRLDEWAALPKMRVDLNACGPTKPTSNDDLSYTAWVTWDDTHLYVAADVTDDILLFPTAGNAMWRCDSFSLCLDARHDTETVYQKDDFQLVFAPSGRDRKPQCRLYRSPDIPEGTPAWVKFAATTRDRGYTIEAAIPWEKLGGPPKAGQMLGFTHCVHDNDGDPQVVRIITWADDPDPADHPLCWGHLILSDTPDDDISAQTNAIAAARPRLLRLQRGDVAELDNTVALRVTSEAAGKLELGIGWNWIHLDASPPEYSDEEWNAYLALLAWTNPRWVRYGLSFAQWEPRNDDHDPDHFDWDGFTFDSPMMKHHYRMLDFCEKQDIAVMVTNWGCGNGGSGWMAETVRNRALKDTDAKWWTDAPYDNREFVESIAALLYQLKTVRKYTCVKQVSLWNEPNGDWSYNSPNAFYPYTFLPLYPLLHEKLSAMGLREEIQICGPDTSCTYEDKAAIPGLLRYVREAVDVISDHDYIGFLDSAARFVPIEKAVPAYARLVADLDATYGRHVPFAIAELGNYGNGAGGVDKDDEVWTGMLSTTELILRTMQVGVSGFLRWEFRPYGGSGRNFGALTTVNPLKLFEPYRPVYYGHALLARHCDRDSTVLKAELSGGKDENGVARVHAAALLLPDQHLTICLVNDGLAAKTVAITLPDLPLPAAAFQHLFYDATLPETIQLGKPIEAAKGALLVALKPRSITTLTTRAQGTTRAELEEPLRLAPQRLEPKTERVALPDGTPADRLTWDFERTSHWSVYRSSPGKSEVKAEEGPARSGKRSLAIHYDFVTPDEQAGREHIVATTAAHIAGKPLRVTAWVHGDGCGQQFAFLFEDAKGETFHKQAVERVDWKGWKQVTLDTSKIPEGFGHWGKDGDAIVDYPITRFGFGFDEAGPDFFGKGTVYLDDLEILTEAPAKP